MTSPQDVLMEAARILMRDGWTQGEIGTDDGPKCASGAIKAATGQQVNNWEWTEAANDALATLESWLVRHGFSDFIPEWNDEPERTAEDVILALKRAASESA